MAMPTQLIICAAIKILIVILTIVVLILLDPEYTVAYISVNYEIVLTYIISSLTLLHCIVSIIMYFIVNRQKIGERRTISLTNCSITEVIFSGAGMIAWMLVCGIGGTISQRTLIETGERFGWIAACAGIIVSLYLAIMALFCLNLMTEKVFSPERNNKYVSAHYPHNTRI
ncbi:putative integral membrane protein [Acanthocheilonema viteae]